MAKLATTAVLDAALDKIATGNQMLVCSSQPTDRETALSSALSSVTLSSGDFTKSDEVSGRKVTIAEKTTVDVTASGIPLVTAIINDEELLATTNITNQTDLLLGDIIKMPSWTITVNIP